MYVQPMGLALLKQRDFARELRARKSSMPYRQRLSSISKTMSPVPGIDCHQS
jgi:hypothetical protein